MENVERWKEEVRKKEIIREKEEEELRSSEGESERGSSSASRISRWGSIRSIGSDDRFSDREVNKLKRWMHEKEREERSNNIVIRGMGRRREELEKEEDKNTWIEKFLEKEIGVECKIMICRISGSVIIAKVEGEDKKKEIMINKSKLKGGGIFIVNDLTWEERKTQEKIHKWRREQRERGIEIKIGTGRVKIGERWRNWEEIEEEKERDGGRTDDEEKERGKERRRVEDGEDRRREDFN